MVVASAEVQLANERKRRLKRLREELEQASMQLTDIYELDQDSPIVLELYAVVKCIDEFK